MPSRREKEKRKSSKEDPEAPPAKKDKKEKEHKDKDKDKKDKSKSKAKAGKARSPSPQKKGSKASSKAKEASSSKAKTKTKAKESKTKESKAKDSKAKGSKKASSKRKPKEKEKAQSPSPEPASPLRAPSPEEEPAPTDPGTDLQSWCEVPSIAHFCSLFRQAFDLLEFDIQELEESLLLMNTEDDTSQLTTRLVIKLLKGCSRTFTNNITEDNYNTYLRRLFLSKREEAEEDHLEYHFECRALLDDGIDFGQLSLKNRVDILNQLCEFRLEAEDVYDKVKNLDASSLRVEPLGKDSEGVTYWYFYGTRLYKETMVIKQHKSKKERKKKKKEKKEKKKKKKKHSRDSISSADEEEVAPKKVSQWAVACLTLQDWEELTEKYKQSKKKTDKELYETLSESFLPEIRQMFVEKEKEEKRKLLMLQPKRASSRIERKRREQEDKDRELAAQLEEQRRLEEEYDEKLRLERQKREEEERRMAREERIRQREAAVELRAQRAAERQIEKEAEEEKRKKKNRLKLKPSMSDIESEEDEDVYEPPKEASKRAKLFGSDASDISDEDSEEEEGASEASDGVIQGPDNSDQKPKKKRGRRKKSKEATYANALLKVGTKSSSKEQATSPSASTGHHVVRKSAGKLLETAGRSLLQRSAGSSNPFDMLAATGSAGAQAGCLGGGASKLSFDLYGGHLPVDHGGYTKPPLGEEKEGGEVAPQAPPKKVFTNWGGEFFKKNLDFRANTNKILEKMNLSKEPSASSSASTSTSAASSTFGARFGAKSESNGETSPAASTSATSSAVIGGSAAAPLTSFIPGERFKALLGATSTQKRPPNAAAASSALDLLAKKTKSPSYYSNF